MHAAPAFALPPALLPLVLWESRRIRWCNYTGARVGF